MEQLTRAESGVNHTNDIDITVRPLANNAKRVLSTPRELISKYIPEIPGLRSVTAFNVLTIIYCIPVCTNQHIADTIYCDNRAVKRSVNYLQRLGFIRIKPQYRYVKPFNSYKQEKTWLITNKGKSVLAKLLDY